MNLREQNEVIDIVKQNPAIKVVRDVAIAMDIETYVVGGFVRDLFLNRESKDIDFVCIGKGIELAEAVAKAAKRKATIYSRFKTAMVQVKGYDLEFVGARKESYSIDSRKPIVEDGTLREDQERRDFTINALSVKISGDKFELVDPFDGVNALKEKMICTPLHPDKTFSDDPLRMMRAIRFASQLTFDIDGDTFTSIERNSDRLEIISMERIADELNKIILSPVPSYGFKLLHHCGLLKYILPELENLKGVEKRGIPS